LFDSFCPQSLESYFTGVGKNPDSVPLVRRTNVTRSHNAPLSIEPHRGKVGKDDVKPSSHKEGRVLQQGEEGLLLVEGTYLVDNSRQLLPKSAARTGDSDALSSAGDVLARKPSRYNVNKASPSSSVKGAYVAPNRERG
jgi:hypothetical protein